MIKNKLAGSDGGTASYPRGLPLEHDGAQNEWKALVDHYSEAETRNKALEQSYKTFKKDLLKNSTTDSLTQV